MPTIFPIIRFHDADAGLAWLEDALGFQEHGVSRGDDGVVQHGELRLGDAWVMIGSETPDGVDRFGSHAGAGFYYLAVDDAGAAFERARSAGADLTSELEAREYGGREFSLRDPEGNVWSLGEYDPSAAERGRTSTAALRRGPDRRSTPHAHLFDRVCAALTLRYRRQRRMGRSIALACGVDRPNRTRPLNAADDVR